MVSESLKDFRNRLDNNLGLTSKRRLLISLAILLLAIQFTGAVFKEVNTFIFKIEFTNQNGLIIFLSLAIVVLLFRYYAYAHEFHHELFNLRAERMLSDYKIFYYNPYEQEVTGLLGLAIYIWGGDDPGIQDIKYQKDGFLQRKLVYKKEYSNEDGSELLDEIISLNKFTDKWKFRHLLQLYWYDFKYHVEALIKYRENLDLLGPYIIASLALILTLLKIEKTHIVQLWVAMTT